MEGSRSLRLRHSLPPPPTKAELDAERLKILNLLQTQGKLRNGGIERLVRYVAASSDWSLLLRISDTHMSGANMALGELRRMGIHESPDIRRILAVKEQERIQISCSRKAERRAAAAAAGETPKAVPATPQGYQAQRAARLAAEREAALRREAAAEALRRATGMGAYLAFFPQARELRRQVVFHVGPTNSGKTWHAMQELAGARHGTYLAPLRLLALEAYDRLAAAGCRAALLTGDDRAQSGEGSATPTHLASTVEMLDTSEHYDVAVIDEVQMLADKARGWAWTRAIVGAAVDKVILVGSRDALPLVQSLCRLTGDHLGVVDHERMSRLRAHPPIGLDDLRPGDAVIAFSRQDLYAIRDELSERGGVAMLYGALSPEVRRAEAERFRSGQAGILVASDAIGMGLNLPLKRVFLAQGSKYDGVEHRALLASELRQICGRAGRGHEDGWAGYIHGAQSALDPAGLQAIFNATPQSSVERCYVMPPMSAIRVAADREGHERLPDLLRMMTTQAMATTDFQPADLSETIEKAERLADVPLSLEDRVTFSMTPVGDDDLDLLVYWARTYAEGGTVQPPEPLGAGLADLEMASRQLTAWLWLHRRKPACFADEEAALQLRQSVNGQVEAHLRSKAKLSLGADHGRTPGMR